MPLVGFSLEEKGSRGLNYQGRGKTAEVGDHTGIPRKD